mgnify:CR=1 FL=1
MAKKSKGTNTLSILSLIFSFLFWPLGLIFGIVSLGQIKKSKEEGKGLAVAGIIISSSAFFITFLLFSSFFIAIGAVSESISDLTIEDIAQVTIDSETLNNWKYIVGENLFKVCYPKSFKNSNRFGVSTLLIMVKRGHEVDLEYSKKKY